MGQQQAPKTENNSMKAAYRFRDKGLLAFADRNYGFAAENFINYRKTSNLKEPAFTDASIYLIRCLLLQNKLSETQVALAYWKKSSKGGAASNYINEINYWEAKYLLTSGSFKASEKILLNLISRPKNKSVILKTSNALGECLFLQKKYEESKSIFTKIKDENPGTSEGLFAQMQLIKLYLIQKKFFWAERQIAENAKIKEFVYKSELDLYTILLHTMKGDVGKALPLYNKYKLTAPKFKNSDWYICSIQLANLLEKKLKFKDAYESYRQAFNAALTPLDQSQVQLRLAECLIKGGNEPEAIKTFRAYLGNSTNKSERVSVTLRLGSLLKKTKNYKGAAEIFKTLQTLSGISPKAKFQAALETGKCQALAGEIAQAISGYLQASKLGTNPDEKGSAIRLAAEASLGLKKFRPAALYYKQAATLFGKTAAGQKATYYQGICLSKAGSFAEANTAFADAIKLLPKSDIQPDIYFQYGRSLKSKGEHIKAAEQFTILSKNYPTHKDVVKGLLIASECYVTGGQAALALSTINEAAPKLTKDPLYPNLLYKLIHLNFHTDIGSVKKALELSATLEKNYPALHLTSDALLWTGDFYSSQGKSELTKAQNAKHIGNSDIAKANTASSIENFNKAKEKYLKLVIDFKTNQLAPLALYEAAVLTFKLGHDAEGLLLQFQKDYPEANKLLQAKVEMLYGEQLTLKGNFGKAMSQFTKAIELFGKHPYGLNARGRLGDCQYTMGSKDPAQYAEAIKTYLDLIEATKKSYDPYKGELIPLQLIAQPLYKLAKAYEKSGNIEAAKRHYSEIITNHEVEVRHQKLPDWKYYARAAFDLTELYMLDKEYSFAKTVLKQLHKSKLPLSKEVRQRIKVLKAKTSTLESSK